MRRSSARRTGHNRQCAPRSTQGRLRFNKASTTWSIPALRPYQRQTAAIAECPAKHRGSDGIQTQGSDAHGTGRSHASGLADTAVDPNLVYFNGIDPDTGTYALPPLSIDDLVKRVRLVPALARSPKCMAKRTGHLLPRLALT